MCGELNWPRVFMTVILLALWLPAGSHALLEEAGWIHAEHADADHEHDAADGICHVTSSHVRAPHPELTAGPLLQWACLLVAFAELCEASHVLPKGPDPPGVAPPELSSTWQFSFRASLPARAPSLIS